MLTPFDDISSDVTELRIEMEDSFKLLAIFQTGVESIRAETLRGRGKTSFEETLDRYVGFFYEVERLWPLVSVALERMKAHTNALEKIEEALDVATSGDAEKTA